MPPIRQCVTKRKQIPLNPPGTGKQSPVDKQTPDTGNGSEACTKPSDRNRKRGLHKGETDGLGVTQAEFFISTIHK